MVREQQVLPSTAFFFVSRAIFLAFQILSTSLLGLVTYNFLLQHLYSLLAWVTKGDFRCPTCALSYKKAVLAQENWFELAHVLNLLLSKGNGFTVCQTGAFTGFNIDTYLGTVTMLTEKFDSVLLAIYSFRILAITTCSLTAEIGGEIMHYSQVVPFLSICAPSL